MIDLHLHTTASDGRSTPDGLVLEARAAGITTMAVTDHDTTAAVGAVQRAAGALGIEVVTGIEITAAHDGRDVHVLGYFIDVDDVELAAFLGEQRADRVRRVLEIAARLEAIGMPIDVTTIVEAGREVGRSVGRPQIAAALVRAGHAVDISDAFDRFIGAGRPGFIERHGGTPADVVRRISSAGGIAALAHPGKTGVDDLIPSLAADGLAALEVFHPDHAADDIARYRDLADELGLFVTGGSDYHGPGSGRTGGLGLIGLPEPEYARLAQEAARRRSGRR